MNENAIYVQSQIACALIEAMGMQAENMQRQHRGESMAYSDVAFNDLIVKYGIHHNAILTLLKEAP